MHNNDKTHAKWYLSLLGGILIVVFLPVVLAFLIWAAISALIEHCKTPLYKKQYEQSEYFKDLRLPYQPGILYQAAYHFYNSAKEKNIPFQFVHQSNNDLAYIVRQNSVYLFPGFDQIGYNDHSGEWEVDLDGDWIPLSEERNNCASLLDDAHKGFAVHFLVTESMLVPRSCFDDVDAPEPPDYAKELLPPFIQLGKTDLSAYTGHESDGDEIQKQSCRKHF